MRPECPAAWARRDSGTTPLCCFRLTWIYALGNVFQEFTQINSHRLRHLKQINQLRVRQLGATYGYQPQDHYILFELTVESVSSTIYSNTGEPIRKRWKD